MHVEAGLEGFHNLSFEAWKKIVLKELKGAPFEKIVWENENSIKVSPYETASPDKSGSSYAFRKNDWSIHQDVSGESNKAVNVEIHEVLNGGVESVGLSCSINKSEDLFEILDGVHIDWISVGLPAVKDPASLLLNYLALANSRGIASNVLTGNIDYDPLGWQYVGDAEEKGWRLKIKEVALIAKYNLSSFQAIMVDASRAHNSGATTSQQLAYALSLGHEYLLALLEEGFRVEEVLPMLHFKFAVGTSYFEDLVKFRAFRSLWAQLIKEYGADPLLHPCTISGVTGLYDFSCADSHTNMLRATTGAMAAIIGGADAMCVLPFDVLYEAPNRFSMRLARNVLHVLREESFLSVVSDPGRGSYYIESLQDKMAQKAWDIFKESEGHGGFEKALASKFFEKMMAASHQIRKQRFEAGKKVLVGVNKYADEHVNAGRDLHHFSHQLSKSSKRLAAEMELSAYKRNIAL